MSQSWQRRLHGLARALGWTAGTVLIALAVLVALVRLSLPLLVAHPQWLAAQLGQRLHRPVHFAQAQAAWRPTGPLLSLRDVVLEPAEGGQPVRIPQLALQLDLSSLLFPSRHLFNLHVRGVRLDLVRDPDGHWNVLGFGVAGGGDQHAELGRLSVDLWLSDSQLDIQDGDRHYALIADRLRLSQHGDSIRAGGTFRRAGAPGSLTGAGRFRRDGSAGRLWLAGRGMDLPKLLAGLDLHGYRARAGHGDAQVWLDWRHGQVVGGSAQLALDQVAAITPDGRSAPLGELHGLIGWRIGAGRDELRWAGDDGGALVLALRQAGTAAARVDGGARGLDLAALLPPLALLPQLPAALTDWLGAGHPHGQVARAEWHWSRADGLESAQATFRGVGIDPHGALPGVDHLDGSLRADAQALSIELPAQAVTVQEPAAFRAPFVMSKLAAELALWHQDDAWHLGIDRLAFEGAGYGGSARGEIRLPDAGGRPFLDLYAALDHADVGAAKLFWPNSLPPPARDWLNRALVAGQVDSAEVLVRGDLKDWPFSHHEGRFEAHAQISGLTLDYGQGWPRAQGIHAIADFVDAGMRVEADAGAAMGMQARHALAVIPDFADGTLELDVDGSGPAAAALAFVRASPIARAQADALGKFDLGGNVDTHFHLVLPFRDVQAFTLAGTGTLTGSWLRAPAWKLDLEKLAGPLGYDGKGFKAGPLQTVAYGQPATLDVAVAGATGDPDKPFDASLHGDFSLAELVADYPELRWIGATGEGRAPFDIGFEIARATAGTDGYEQALTIHSSLSGIKLDLPAPLDKAAPDALPLSARVVLPLSGGEVTATLGELARGQLRLPTDAGKPLAASLQLGTDAPAPLPQAGIRVRGHAARLDVTGWAQQSAAGFGQPMAVAAPAAGSSHAASSAAAVNDLLESVDVRADRAIVFGRDFANLRLRVHDAPGTLEADVDAPALAGHASVPTTQLAKRGITARMVRLYWPGAPTPNETGGSIDSAPPPHPENTGVDPTALPPLHVSVADLRLGAARLGSARLESWPTAAGMHIDELRTHSPSVQIDASGNWNGNAQNSQTAMRVDFAAENLGQMLGALGYEGLVSGGRTQVTLAARWPGAPSSIDLATMDGTLSVHVEHGRILEVAPGVGRLFGLVSLAEVPRRLSLDFGDVFGKGLAFDTIRGTFRLDDGNAYTSDLSIKGPAADITVSGRTGLRKKDYDQRLVVVPHIGNSLPVVGAVLGGPVGIAAGLAVQGLLGHGINRAAVKRYAITGSWSKPLIVPLDQGQSLPAAAGSAARPASSGVH